MDFSLDSSLRPFDGVDIYLFDQLLKGRVTPGMRVLDAGCGPGRNAAALARLGCAVYAADESAEAVASTRERVRAHDPVAGSGRFRTESLDALSFSDGEFGAVVCIAVLHFARDDTHFRRMLDELWRVLAPDGVFLARLASSIGIEERVEALGRNRYRLPDGTERYLVDDGILDAAVARLGAELLDPVKTTIVRDRRAMTTVCLRKAAGRRRV